MEWIKCSDRLPEDNQEVLIYDKDKKVELVAFCFYQTPNYKYYTWENNDKYYKGSEVTHWMPLPEPPKVEE